ncbi:uncharacterized protein LOC143575890 [Bidens hawaiensis]|uniref:uncharacterized protein LOC143575890 n=1 Tax=Bidens hawaiensis TaxID=980011 RepID=UPI00404A85A9
MSMNKVANLAKRGRVIASKVLDSNTLKMNHSKETLTMGELISCNKWTRKREALKQNLAKPACVKPVSKKRFALVDDDDVSDDEVSQDVNKVDNEPTYSKDAGDEGHIVRSQDCVEQDNEYEDMDFIAPTYNDEEMQWDDSHDYLEDEDVALVQDQLHRPELEKAIESKTKKRGPTMMHSVHTWKVGEREVIICNEFGQPVGLTHAVSQFSQFLALLLVIILMRH